MKDYLTASHNEFLDICKAYVNFRPFGKQFLFYAEISTILRRAGIVFYPFFLRIGSKSFPKPESKES